MVSFVFCWETLSTCRPRSLHQGSSKPSPRSSRRAVERSRSSGRGRALFRLHLFFYLLFFVDVVPGLKEHLVKDSQERQWSPRWDGMDVVPLRRPAFGTWLTGEQSSCPHFELFGCVPRPSGAAVSSGAGRTVCPADRSGCRDWTGPSMVFCSGHAETPG